MWHEIHWSKLTACFVLVEGTETGYKFTKLYYCKFTAKVSAKIHGYKFCD